MPIRHAGQARSLVAFALAIGFLPLVALPANEAPCPAPAVPVPAGCCAETTPPSCPSCPGESRPSCPTAPARARTCCSCEFLPPSGSAQELRESRAEEPERTETAIPANRSAKAVSAARRASVRGASPPVHLLACSFRN